MRVTLVLLAALVLVGPPAASAADSHAPPGAPAHWLPNEDWVLEHWLPYKESRLYAVLGVDRNTVQAWLRGNTRSLAQLAQERGVRTRGLARRLVGRPRGLSARRRAVLVARARRTLTQPHLAQHMIGHLMHVRSLQQAMPAIFGMPMRDIIDIRQREKRSYADIGAMEGRTVTELRRGLARALRRTMRRGVRLRAIPRRQARAWLGRQEENLPRWLAYVPPGEANDPPPDDSTSGHHASSSEAMLCAVTRVRSG